MTRQKVCSRVAPSVSAASSTSRRVRQHRLHRAHDERQADEDQRDDDAERRVGDLEPEPARGSAPSSRCRRIERGQRDAGDRGRQREGQVDQRVEQPPAGEAVAHQHPGDEQAEDAVDQRGERRRRRRLSRSAASARGDRSAAARCRRARAPRRWHDQRRRAGSGRSATARASVMPSDRPKPGRTLGLRQRGGLRRASRALDASISVRGL